MGDGSKRIRSHPESDRPDEQAFGLYAGASGVFGGPRLQRTVSEVRPRMGAVNPLHAAAIGIVLTASLPACAVFAKYGFSGDAGK